MGQDLDELTRERLRAQRRDLQIIFQDPLGSLDPRMRVGEIVAEGLRVHEPALTAAERAARGGRDARARRTAGRAAGALPARAQRRPGPARRDRPRDGPRARSCLVCDEPVSSLDVPSQVQVVDLLARLKRESGLSLAVRQPQPCGGAPPVRARAGAVPGADDGAGRGRAPVLTGRAIPTRASCWTAVPLPDPAVQPARLGRGARRRGALAAAPALRVRLPHPLPARAAGVRRAAARLGGGRPRGVCRLPPLARDRRPDSQARVLHEIARAAGRRGGAAGILPHL